MPIKATERLKYRASATLDLRERITQLQSALAERDRRIDTLCDQLIVARAAMLRGQR